MLDRGRLNKLLDVRDTLEGMLDIDITVYASGDLRVWATPCTWQRNLSEDERHRALALLTPFVGKMERANDIDYQGEGNGVTIYINRASECKIVGYRTVKKTVKREIEKPVEYEEVEEEIREAVTDCDLKAGRATKEEIEVPA